MTLTLTRASPPQADHSFCPRHWPQTRSGPCQAAGAVARVATRAAGQRNCQPPGGFPGQTLAVESMLAVNVVNVNATAGVNATYRPSGGARATHRDRRRSRSRSESGSRLAARRAGALRHCARPGPSKSAPGTVKLCRRAAAGRVRVESAAAGLRVTDSECHHHGMYSGTARQAGATVGRPLPGPADSDRGPGPAGGAAAARPPSPEHGRPTDSDSDQVGLARLGPSPTAESPPTVTVGALPSESAGGQVTGKPTGRGRGRPC
jgi:hypothetical protein